MTTHRPRFHLVLVLCGAAAPGCNCSRAGGGDLVNSEGVPSTVPQLNFGNVRVGQTASLQLPLANTGSAALQITSQTVDGGDFAEATPFQSSVSQGGTIKALVSFTPAAAGPATGTLTIGDDGDPSQVVVALLGNGVDLSVTVTPASLDFGQVPVGITPAPTQNVTLTNATTSALYLTLSGANTAPQYTLSSSGKALSTAPIQLAAGGSTVVTVAFEPTAVSVYNSSFGYIACEDAASTTCLPQQTVAITGQGVSGSLVFSPSPVAFTGVATDTPTKQTVTLTNIGAVAATVSCLYLQSVGATGCGTASSLFSLGAPTPALPATLDAGAALTFDLTYAATQNGNDVLAATYVTQGTTTAATAIDDITATVYPAPCQITITPASLSFSNATVHTPITESVTLTNGGNMSCNVTGIAIDKTSDPSYALATGQATTLTLAATGAAGDSATIGVTFDLDNKNSPSTRKGLLDFASNDPSHASVQIPLLATLASPYAGGGAWPRWHHDNVQSGLSPNDTSALAGRIAWTANVGVPGSDVWGLTENDYMNSPVVGSDGTIYQLGMNGTLYAFNPDGGAQWATTLEGPIVDTHPGTPIIASDNTIFVAFGDVVIDNAAMVGTGLGFYQISSTGQILKSIPPADQGDGYDLPPMLTNGGLLLGADDVADCQVSGISEVCGGAFAYSISSGSVFTQAASASIPAIDDQYSAVVGPDDTTYWCSGSQCYALNPPASGFTRVAGWPAAGISVGTGSDTSDLSLDVGFTGNLIGIFGGWTYSEDFLGQIVSVFGSQQLVAINPANGSTVWSLTLPGPSAAQENADPQYGGIDDATVGNSCPAIGPDGTVYVGNFDGLHAVDGATGKEKTGWPFKTTGNVLTAPAIGGDGTIFFGTDNGVFYAVTPAGTLRFSVNAGGRIAGSPAIGPSGAVYFTADDGKLYAVE